VKYMFLLYDIEEAWEPTEEEMALWAEFSQEAARMGAKELDGEVLEPSPAARVVSVRKGKRFVTDGPFAETREQLGSYFVFECEDMDTAVRLAEKLPLWSSREASGHVEIRPVMDLGEYA
jgi:hypothetical protein